MLAVSGDAVTKLSIYRIDIPVLKIERGPPLFASYYAAMQRQAASTCVGAWQSLHIHQFGWPGGGITSPPDIAVFIVLSHSDRNPAVEKREKIAHCARTFALCPDKSRRVAIHPRRLHSILPSTYAAAISSHPSRDVQASTAQHRDVCQQPPVLIAHEQSTLRAARGPDPSRFHSATTLPAIARAGLTVSRAPVNSVTRLQS